MSTKPLPTKSEFIAGAPSAEALMLTKAKLRLEAVPCVAFAGRSNVGKSTLLNALMGARLARVSTEPGRTREMNLFSWRGALLVDLPGYGFAKVSKAERAAWGREIPAWMGQDQSLCAVVILADGRIGLTPDDVKIIEYVQTHGFNYKVVFTKMDKYKSANQRRNAENALTKAIAEAGLSIENTCFVAAEKKQGLSPLINYLQSIIKA